MYLSNEGIVAAQNQFSIFTPWHPQQVQPASYDVLLSNEFYYPDTGRRITVQGPLMLRAKEFVLGCTLEYIRIPNTMAATVMNKSSHGRRGLGIENAGWIDPGFQGQLTLELFNFLDKAILIHPGQRIAQVQLALVSSPAIPYNGNYQGQVGVTQSVLA